MNIADENERTKSATTAGNSATDRRIVIVGAGPGGICIAIGLKAAGYHDFVILERGAGIGGTWFHNRYPGAACDVPSHLYSFSFEPYDWTRPYAGQAEIQAYLEHCIDKYGIAHHVRLNCPVQATHWHDDRATWHVVTPTEVIETDILISAIGLMNEPSFPDIPGLEDFRGVIFHSARWASGHELAGRRVATIGTGASAVQLIPEVAKQCEHLYVFQRSAQWVLPKGPDEFTPGQREELRTSPEATRNLRQEIFDQFEVAMTFSNPEFMRLAEEAGLQNVASVEDPVTRQALTPATVFGCLRPLVSNDYYPTFNRDNVQLVSQPVLRVTADAIVTSDGQQRPVDTIVLATGFQTTRYLTTMEITGRGGQRLTDAWQEGPEAYLGVVTSGFPNLFMLYGPNTNNGSILFMIERQAEYIVRKIHQMDADCVDWIDVRPDVMKQYNHALQGDIGNVVVWQASCSNYYRTPGGRIVTQWPHTMTEYERRTSADDRDAFERFSAAASTPHADSAPDVANH